MSIHNLSNDRGGIGPMRNQISFLRDDFGNRRADGWAYGDDAGSNAGDAHKAGQPLLFDGGSGRVDYRGIARAMMARLDALRERCFGGGQCVHQVDAPADETSPAATPNTAPSDALLLQASDAPAVSPSEPMQQTEAAEGAWRPSRTGWRPKHWLHHGQWYNTSDAPASSPPNSPPSSSSPSNSTTTSTPSSSTNPTSPSTSPPPPAIPNAPVVQFPPNSTQVASGTISLHDGAATIANKYITGEYGIMAENDTHVTSLNVSNVTIHSTNYGIYLGSADSVNLSNVHVVCDPNGGDSYSMRGAVRQLYSSDSTYQSGIKAFRIYGLENGSSTRDTFTGDRLMLGGGYDNEWDDGSGLGSFHNFRFADGRINVNSIEIYDDTSNVVFENMDFSGTGHISIQPGARDIVFKNCTNLPEIRLYDGNSYSTGPDASRNILVVN